MDTTGTIIGITDMIIITQKKVNMKKVVIKDISMNNFKGIKELTVYFGEKQTTISGRNASGKTTIFDAFTWCLFGKDSSGRSDSANGGFMVKTVDAQGDSIPRLEHSVFVTLLVDGEEIVFGRQLVEEWGTKRGSSEQKLTGNVTHYYIDGVEVNAAKGDGNYEECVGAVMNENLFRQITSPDHFTALPWKEQRELLLTIAGDVTLEDIAQGNATYEAVMAEAGGKNIDDYKKFVSNRRKDIEAEMKLIPARISGIQMATPEAENYTEIEADLKKQGDELISIETEMLNTASAQRKQYEAARNIQQQIFKLQSRQAEIFNAAKQDAENKQFSDNTERYKATARIEVLRKQDLAIVSRTSEEKTAAQQRIQRYQQQIEQLQKQRTDLLTKWETRNAEQANEEAAADHFDCPLCHGLECRNEELVKNYAVTCAKAREDWYKRQSDDLEDITAQGKQLKAQIEQTKQMLETAKREDEEIRERAANEQREISEELKRLHDFVVANPEAQAEIVTETDIPEWVELQSKINALKAQMDETADANPAEINLLKNKKEDVQKKIDTIKSRLATKQLIDENQKKISRENDRLRELAEQKAEIEGQEMAIEEMVKRQSEEIERRVNSLFQLVKFRMFESQVNGGEKPTCIATVNGVRYGDLNSAMKINAGLDIINTICAYNEVTAPIFIDNAEGVNTLQPTKSQVIRLVVTDGELTITKD